MFQPLPTPHEMAAWDRQAIKDYGIRGEMLMENAARAAVDVLAQSVPFAGTQALILAGPGNNGGDGFAMARRMQDMGGCPVVVHTKPKKAYRGEARYHLDLARRIGVPMHYLPRFDFSSLPAPAVVVDALLGTGFSGELRAEALDLVRRINAYGRSAFVLAVDCPTGLSAETGLPLPEAVRADMTATMHAIKLGLALPHAAPYTGTVRICEIGIPAQVAAGNKAAHQLIGPGIMDLAPRPQPDMHKGTAGHVLVIGGATGPSGGLTGAPHLAALAALRAGAGLATIACPQGLEAAVKAASPDIMTLPLGSGNDWHPKMVDGLAVHLERFDAVVVGPGMGRSPEASDFLFDLLAGLQERQDLPCVLDADALYHLAQRPGKTPPQAILTPHPGEMGRFLGISSGAVQAGRFKAARTLAERTDAAVVLKGAGTVIAAPGGTTYLCSLSAPNLAVAGSGDVLSGLLGALLAASIAPLPGACLGVYWHGLVGKTLAQDYPGRGNLASQIADALPGVHAKYSKEQPCRPHATS